MPAGIIRSYLFVPADSERKIARALSSTADAVILDLEDSVSAENRPAGRHIVRTALENWPADGPDVFVRINPVNAGMVDDDLSVVAPAEAGIPVGIVQPKTDGAKDISALASRLPCPRPIIAIATETATSMFHLASYNSVREHLYGLSWGAEDLSAALGATSSRDEHGQLTAPYQLARTLCLLGARAADVEPIDTVFVDFKDHDGLRRECAAAARDGFSGKLAIHPAQIDIINEVFMPSARAIASAERIVEAFHRSGNAGTIAIDGEMLDRPHLMRAERILARASNRQSQAD